MLDIRQFVSDPDSVRIALKNRGASFDLDGLLGDERELSSLRKQWEALRERRNRLAEEVGRLKKEGQDASERMQESRAINAEIARLEGDLAKREDDVRARLLLLPNVPHPTVPIGPDETGNREIRRTGTPRTFEFEPKPHWEIGAGLGLLDFDGAAVLSGSRFSVLKGPLARLERALVAYMIDVHTRTDIPRPSQKPYTEVSVPFLVRPSMLEGTGQLPKFREEIFAVPEDDLYLIPTAEVPVTNLHRDGILDETALPVKYVSATACFRREAGAAGKDTRGLIRQHQFTKVELVWITRPETSYSDLEELTQDAESVLSGLDLPYRTIALCTGDLGFSSAKTYDIEVWMPSQGVYREISSCSNFESFQARRAGIRYRTADAKKPKLVHTMNGSGVAVGRTIAAILENFQNADGSVRIPDPLVPYMGGVRTLDPVRK
jgi:seryl-tRNA synthetase